MNVEAILALAARLRSRARKATKKHDYERAGDDRLASIYLRKLSAIMIAGEVEHESDPIRRIQLLEEIVQLRQGERLQ